MIKKIIYSINFIRNCFKNNLNIISIFLMILTIIVTVIYAQIQIYVMNKQISVIYEMNKNKNKRYVELLIYEIDLNLDLIQDYNKPEKKEWYEKHPQDVPITYFFIKGFDIILENMAATDDILVKNIEIVRSKFIDFNSILDNLRESSNIDLTIKQKTHFFNEINSNKFHEQCINLKNDLSKYKNII